MPDSEQSITSHSPKAGVTVVTPTVDIDMSRSPELRSVLRQALDAGTSTLVVNLSEVHYMDSSGLATLVEAMRNAKSSDTKMILATLNERVRAIFEIARLDQFFTIVDSLDQAL